MWITRFRERYDMTELEFAQALSDAGARLKQPVRVSEPLLHLLEVRKGAVTHPKIADLIATVCGATPRERDMIVAEPHRGTWNGPTEEQRKAVGWT